MPSGIPLKVGAEHGVCGRAVDLQMLEEEHARRDTRPEGSCRHSLGATGGYSPESNMRGRA